MDLCRLTGRRGGAGTQQRNHAGQRGNGKTCAGRRLGEVAGRLHGRASFQNCLLWGRIITQRNVSYRFYAFCDDFTLA